MFRRIRLSPFAFSKQAQPQQSSPNQPKQPKPKPNALLQAFRYINQMKPFIIPGLHKDKKITHALLKSYSMLAASKLCFFGGPFLLKLGVNALSSTTASLNPLLYFFGFGVCYTGSVLFEQMRNVQTLKLINAALVQTTTKAYKHMLSLGPEFYFSGSQRHILFNLYKAQSAFEQNLKMFTQYIFPITLDVTLSISLLMYYSNPLFALSFTGCLAAYSIFTVKYSDYRHTLIKKFRKSQKHIDFVTSQTFGNYYNVKYFQQQHEELMKYHQSLQDYYAKSYEVQRSLGILNTAQRAIFGSGLTFNMMLAAYYTQIGLLTTGDIIMIQSLMLQFLSPLFFLGTMYRSFNQNLIDINKITDIMQTPSKVVEGTQQVASVDGKIQFKNVGFSYLYDSNFIFNNLNFTIKEGSFVAVMGRSGSGKTSILNLIFRLYDPQEGNIEIDGKNIRDLNFSFRNHVSFVSQTPYLFNGTVMENLKYGNPNATEEQIFTLTKRLNLHDIIMLLPKKYDTNVGEKGNIFSGGQKQRLSIIRSLLRKTKIILLDQPTSALDAQTEQIVGEILSQLKGVTRIIVTHRQGILYYTDETIRVS